MTLSKFITFSNSRFLGMSGQNLDDIFKYVPSDSRLDLAQSMIEWAHIAPTAPDTLCKSFTYHVC